MGEILYPGNTLQKIKKKKKQEVLPFLGLYQLLTRHSAIRLV